MHMEEQHRVITQYEPVEKVLTNTEGHATTSLGMSIITLGNSHYLGAVPKKMNYMLYLDMYYNHPMVFAAINKIAKVATHTGFDFVPRDSRTKAKSREIKVAKTFFDMQDDFLGQLRRVYRDLLIFGDAYLNVVYSRGRKPVRLKRLAPWTIHIKANRMGHVEYYVQRDPNSGDEEPIKFRPEEILHFRIDDPGNDLYGMSPLEAIKTTVAADLYAQNWNKNFFKNGASTGTIMVVKDATVDEIERNKRWLEEAYVGTENAHKPIILTGDVEVHHSVIKHEDMSFLQGRQYLKNEILAVLDVPPAKVGEMGSANRSNSKEQDKSFRSESVAPLQYIVESVISDQLLQNVLGLKETVFQHSQADIRDAQEQMNLWVDGTQNGIMNINEVRSKMGLIPVDGGDINYVQTATGAVPLDRMNLYFALPRQNIEDIPPVPEDPPEGEPAPERTANEGGGLNPPVSPIGKGMAAAIGAWLRNGTDDSSLRQAYAYAVEFSETHVDIRSDEMCRSIQKAMGRSDPTLRQAFIERAYIILQDLAREKEGNHSV